MKLYAWQQECLKAWEGNGCRGIVNVVTGAGKTVLALEAIRRFRRRYGNARIRIVVPTIPLAQQWQSALLQEAESEDDRPGFFGAGHRDAWDRRMMIYIINSAREHLANHMEQAFALGQPVLLICDECHHCQSKENRKIFRFQIPPFFPTEQFATLGLSATPFGTAHDEVLISGLGQEIYRYGFSEASADQIVSPFTVVETAATFLPDERKRYIELSRELTVLWARLLKQWVILFDEAELIGRMGKKTRLKSYREMQTFLQPGDRMKGVFSLFALSSSFAEDVIDKKHEMESAEAEYAEDPAALKAVKATLNAMLNAPELTKLSREETLQILAGIQSFHGKAYHWNPQVTPETIYAETEAGGYLLRTKIRAAIEYVDQLYQYGEAGKTRITELGKESFEEEETPELP